MPKPHRPCLFCGLKQSKLTRHLINKHFSEDRVKSIMRLPKQLQHQAFDHVKKEGILKANKDIMKNTDLSQKELKKQLIRERRQGKDEQDLSLCSLCSGFYAANTIHKHKRNCVGAEATTKEPVSIPLSLISDTSNIQYREEVLAKFRKDEIGNLCRTDNFIKLLGFQTYVKGRSRQEKKVELRDGIMSDMRRYANLFLEFKSLAEKKKKKITSSIDMLARDHFPFLQEAIMNVTTKEDGSIKSGLKTGIGFLLKKAANVLKGQYLIQKEDERAREVDNFVIVLQHFWSAIFSDAQYANMKARQTDLRKPKHLPNEEDILKLRNFITEEQKKLLESPVFITNKEFGSLRDILVCRLTLFNARRGGPSRLLLREWEDAHKGVWISDSAVQALDDPTEKQMLGQYKIAYQSGKNMNQMVPVLIPNDCIEGLKILACKETRTAAGVHPANIFLFPSMASSEKHIKGWHAVDNVCKRAQIKSRINATSVRHRAATLYAALDVPERERELFYKYIGHSEEINRHVYQCPLAIQEVTKVGKYFENLDRPPGLSGGTYSSGETSTASSSGEQVARKTKQVNYDAIKNDSDIDDSDNDEDYNGGDEDSGEDDDSNKENDGSRDDEITFKVDEERKADNFNKKGHRIRWLEKDTNKVKKYFKSYIDDTSVSDRTGPLPGKLKVYAFIKKYPEVLGSLGEGRKLFLIRTKIYNERNKTRRIVYKHLNAMRK